jgi:hypothetical protein
MYTWLILRSFDERVHYADFKEFQIIKKLLHLGSAEMYVMYKFDIRIDINISNALFPRIDPRWRTELASEIDVDSQIVN